MQVTTQSTTNQIDKIQNYKGVIPNISVDMKYKQQAYFQTGITMEQSATGRLGLRAR